MRGILIYKCRLCGGAEWVEVEDVQSAMLLAHAGHEQDTTDIVIPHRCENGDYGIADLLGARETGAS